MSGRQQFTTLHAMRGVAALSVAALHAQARLFGGEVAPSGYLAVDLFFALSGFVLAHVYDGRGLSTGAFLKLRMIRLYPLYAVGLALGIVVVIAAHMAGREPLTWSEAASSAALNALYLPAVAVAALYPLNIPFWSLGLEMAVNAVFCSPAYRSRWGAVALAAIGAVLVIAAGLRHGSLDAGGTWDTLWIGAGRALWSFSVGVLLCRSMDRRPLPGWVAVVVLIISGAALCVQPGLLRGAYDLGFVLLASPAVIWLGSRSEVPRLIVRPFVALGDASYALYAIHFPLVSLFAVAGPRFGLSGWPLGVAFLACSTAAALVLARTYDPWARRWLGRPSPLATPLRLNRPDTP